MFRTSELRGYRPCYMYNGTLVSIGLSSNCDPSVSGEMDSESGIEFHGGKVSLRHGLDYSR